MSEPSHEQVLQFVRAHRKPFVTTADTSEQFPEVTRRTVYKRLKDLHDQGQLQKRQIGARAVVWYEPA